MNRRAVISLLGGAVASWASVARAQQQALPVVGVLDSGSRDDTTQFLAAFRRGLADAGYVDGQNVAIDYRSADGHYDRLPSLAAELVRRRVGVIAVPSSTPAAQAAKAATATIPVVFGVGDDPVKLGLVASLARPGGNATGINFFIGELAAKRLGLLHELAPGATRVAVLVNPTDAARTESIVSDVAAAARDLGLQIDVLNASTIRQIDEAFAALAHRPPGALFVGPDSFFNSRRVQLAILAARHAVPACYGGRSYADVGGLMSYGTSLDEARRQVGVYAGQILKGVKPADLPVIQPTKFELVINLSAAKALGIDVQPTLLARADEVIE
jgi:putative ABC transport system substrate-binding protein